MDELLDLINEKDEVIGEVGKNRANNDPRLLHREILIYLFDEKKRMLMQQRSFNKKVCPGEWAETCSGHVGKGEKPETAAHRELAEEMGFDTKLKFVAKRWVRLPREKHLAYCYVGKYRGEKIVFDKKEVETVKLVEKKDFKKYWGESDDAYLAGEVEWVERIWNNLK